MLGWKNGRGLTTGAACGTMKPISPKRLADNMRNLVCALMLLSMPVLAAAPMDRFDPVQFEQRFHKADKGNKGRLTRAEAYAEFPRMPEFFDEIDSNKDQFITLEEVRQAMERRVNAAIEASSPAQRYGSVDAGTGAATGIPATPGQGPRFSSKEEARRYYRNEYYESLAESRERARDRGQPVSDSPSSPFLKKSF